MEKELKAYAKTLKSYVESATIKMNKSTDPHFSSFLSVRIGTIEEVINELETILIKKK